MIAFAVNSNERGVCLVCPVCPTDGEGNMRVVSEFRYGVSLATLNYHADRHETVVHGADQ